MNGKNYLLDSFKLLGIPYHDDQIEKFELYYKKLVEVNKVMNLTSITDEFDVYQKHFVDSLMLCSFRNIEGNLKVIDIGTGAGFPGIPLKINKRDLDLTLLDSLAKRLKFLEEVAAELELDNVKFVHSRAEDAGRDAKYREKFDIATARAVANLPVLCEYCLPFVKKGGCFIAMKGKLDEELKSANKAISMLGGEIETIKEFQLPGTDADRTVVVIRKIKETPKRFPRQAGKPSKEPIV